MSWSALKRGPWTKDAPEDRLDPYLLWADTTDFADFRFEEARSTKTCMTFDSTRHFVPVLIKLKCPIPQVPAQIARAQTATSRIGVLLDILKIGAPAGRYQLGSRFLTLKINHQFMGLLKKYHRFHRWIRRVELCLAIRPERDIEPWIQATGTGRPDVPVLGVIDDGCPFARAGFRIGVSTRVRAIWDQSKVPAFDKLNGMADRADLNKFIAANTRGQRVDEDGVYAAADYARVRRRASHGAHVLDIFAGPVPPRNRVPSWPVHPPTFKPEPPDNATTGDIVFVQLPQVAVQDNSGKWLGVHILDGLRFICSHVGRHGRAVVNISYGPQTGPHDGTSLLK